MTIVAKAKWLVQSIADLCRHEGFRPFPYPDPLSKLGKKYAHPKYKWGYQPARLLLAKYGESELDGKPWTNGFGETLNVTPDTPEISKERAAKNLEPRVVEHATLLNKMVPNWQAAPLHVQTVLVNLAYNMGTRLNQFGPTLQLFIKGDYPGASGRLRKTAWFKQVGDRSEELCTRLEKGEIAPQHRVI